MESLRSSCTHLFKAFFIVICQFSQVTSPKNNFQGVWFILINSKCKLFISLLQIKMLINHNRLYRRVMPKNTSMRWQEDEDNMELCMPVVVEDGEKPWEVFMVNRLGNPGSPTRPSLAYRSCGSRD